MEYIGTVSGMSKAERLQALFQQLDLAPAAGNADTAYRLLCDTLDQIEDRHSGTPNNPDQWREDGRLYPPQADRLLKNSPLPDTRCYRSVEHFILFGSQGAIGILDGEEAWVYRKAGKDGRMMT